MILKMTGLIYDRKLKLGVGDSLYGLEFAKSLHIDNLFISKAYEIRESLIGSVENEINLSQRIRRKE